MKLYNRVPEGLRASAGFGGPCVVCGGDGTGIRRGNVVYGARV